MKRMMISMFTLLLLCGCTATTQLKDRTVVTALTFDERGGEFHVLALCLRSSENGAEKLIASGSGLSPFSALDSLCLAQKNIYFGHISGLIISSRAAESHLRLLSEAIADSPVPERAEVYLYDGDPSYVLQADLEGHIEIADEIKSIREKGKAEDSFFYLRRALAGGEAARLSVIELYTLGEAEEKSRLSLRTTKHADIEP